MTTIRIERAAAALLTLGVATALSLHAASAGPQEEATAKLIAEYFVKARSVLSLNQGLINASGKGDKGFTPAAYEKQFADDFQKMTGKDVRALSPADPVDKVLVQLHAAAKEIIAEAQPQINEPGKGWKGFSPAIFGKRTADRFEQKTGLKVKQTSLQYRGSYNKPDAFEAKVLENFQGGWERGKIYTETTTVQGKKAARLLFPLYITQTCLPCHGEPKGELDISGRKKEGYKEGDVRGAISVMVPVK